MYCPMILRNKFRVDSLYNGLDMALFIPGLNASKTAIFVRTMQAEQILTLILNSYTTPYTTPLHVIRIT